MKKAYELIATVCGIGRIPLAPGTFGSLAGLVTCYLLHKNILLYLTAFVMLFILGTITSGRVEKDFRLKDPPFIVIDEFAGIFIAFLFVPLKPSILIIGFILYRFVDIVKIPPMRRIEKLEGGWGIMLDDLLAGIYTNLILHLLVNVF